MTKYTHIVVDRKANLVARQDEVDFPRDDLLPLLVGITSKGKIEVYESGHGWNEMPGITMRICEEDDTAEFSADVLPRG